jgi:trehalose synthase
VSSSQPPPPKLVSEVQVGRRELRRFEPHVGAEAMNALLEAAAGFRELLGHRVVWNVNSTAVGGGVAEMLQPLLGYTRGAGVDTRWLVIGGEPEFFELTKRIHHALHGSEGNGRPLDDRARAIYDAATEANAAELTERIQPKDIVLLHDPQTAGLAPALMAHGARVIWRCHIGIDEPNEETEGGWAFLRPYLEGVPAYVFSRREYAPSWLDPSRLTVVQPSIDAFSAKNQELSETQVRSIVTATGLVGGSPPVDPDRTFHRADGTPSRVERVADVVRFGAPPPLTSPLVVQVSRWDPLKDMAGVMGAFVHGVGAGVIPDAAHLVLAGPDVRSVADDPEAPAVFEDVVARCEALGESLRARIHLANLPTDDVEENAAMVNALQRHAAVVMQKSLQEGFGLTVTEAMWKARPVIASAVGGIRDQIQHGRSGLLHSPPDDLVGFGRLLGEVLGDPERAAALGRGARERVREQFLGVRHLMQYASLLRAVDEAAD